MSLRFGMAAVAGGLAPVGAMLFPPDAKAGLESCGNINVSADAKCTVVAKAECTTQHKMMAACASDLQPLVPLNWTIILTMCFII